MNNIKGLLMSVVISVVNMTLISLVFQFAVNQWMTRFGLIPVTFMEIVALLLLIFLAIALSVFTKNVLNR